MVGARILDVLLVLVLLVIVGEGFRNGFARSIGAVLGIVSGGIAAFFAIPVLAAIVPDRFWRVAAVVAVSIALLAAGQAIGSRLGRGVRDPEHDSVGAGSRILGGALNGVIAALTVALVAGGVGALGVPVLSQAISGSAVLRAIDTATPPVIDVALARIRSAVLEEGLPSIGEALGGITDSPGVPDAPTPSDPLTTATASVVRIGGTAFACGQNQTGTGFVVAADRVVTNAHVVAGVDSPVVDVPDGSSLAGRVVYFDPVDDLAVIAVDGLAATPLALSADLEAGDAAVISGYPHGGPLTTGGADVLAVSIERLPDIYGRTQANREVYALAALVQPGNSGGPLLTTSGQVAGVVFARSATDTDLGYAMTADELRPVASAAAGLTDPIAAASCIPG